ncbi:MAG: NlpC/P60 family protein [Corynebacterium sp.]|nr:NlpC/P60 family protein [Corynebacterium sp.]
MGKHTRQTDNKIKAGAAASALAVGAVSIIAQPASAATVTVPNTDFSFEVQGLEDVPNIKTVPGIGEWVPEFEQQADVVTYEAPVEPEKTVGEQIVEFAESRKGAPYSWGATGPDAFDCSGLTTWAYAQVGKSIPRTSYAQAAQGAPVARQDLQPGDIIAFYSGASHVGIYTGHGTVVHAVNYGTPLGENALEYMPYHSAVRF